MLKTLDFSIIFVNYNSTDDLTGAINSLLKVHDQKIPYEILIVDNNSTKSDSDKLKKMTATYRKIIPINTFYLHQNLGFGGANNYAAARARGKYLLFLNPDTLCPRPILGQLWRDLERQHIGIVAPQLILRSGAPQEYAAGDFPTLANLWRSHTRWQKNAIPAEKNGKLMTRDWLSGAALAISRDHFQKVNGFDERFFMYFEDVDLCQRVQQSGLKNYLDKSIQIIHLGGERQTVSRGRRQRYFTAQDQYFRRWRPQEYSTYRLLVWPYKVFRYWTDPHD